MQFKDRIFIIVLFYFIYEYKEIYVEKIFFAICIGIFYLCPPPRLDARESI